MHAYGRTQGFVAYIDTRKHGAMTVRYSVGQATYSQTFPPEGLDAGDPVLVRYDPRDPKIALLKDPREVFYDAVNYSVAGGAYLGMVAAIIGYWLRAWRQPAAQTPIASSQS
jgi:hypothetical protein